MKSRAIQQLEEKMSALQPGTIRHEALLAAKRFKSSWIELGKLLWTVFKEKRYREWGYLTFEAYCAKEIQIRAATAKKLLHSYYFLEKEEPGILQGMEENPARPAAPSMEAVNLLRLLKKRQGLPAGGYQRLRSYALEEGKEPTELRREVRSMIEEAHPDPEAARSERRAATLKRMIGLLKGMKLELEASDFVPKKLTGEVESLIRKLEAVLP
ncbi:MAG: hypothetical protein HYZ90_00555 [Candidatus Omnitrophica bacterium]|nr:hypothetical protein [Candidatus Omnitrophota bacterium]